MTRNLGLKQRYQLRLHEGKVVWNLEADDALATEVGLELGRQLGTVYAFHDEDEICPGNKLRSDWIVGIMAQASGRSLDAWKVGEHLLGGGASQPVAAANKKHVARQVVAPAA